MLDTSTLAASRAPHGARGLKFFWRGSLLFSGLSRPARGAWIEIRFIGSFGPRCYRRAPHGARGLKFDNHIGCDWLEGRAPHGARGL